LLDCFLCAALENKIVGLERELERTKLAEFETQESVMLINDSVQNANSENSKLKMQLKSMEERNYQLTSQLEDAMLELESLKCKYEVDFEKLQLAEAELKKVGIGNKHFLDRQVASLSHKFCANYS